MSLVEAVKDYLELLADSTHSISKIDAARERLAAEAAVADGAAPADPDGEAVPDKPKKPRKPKKAAAKDAV